MQYGYHPFKYSQDHHTVSIPLLVLSTFAPFSLYYEPRQSITMASIAEAPMEEFHTWTFGPDESINLFTISFGRMKADFFFCEPSLYPACIRGKRAAT